MSQQQTVFFHIPRTGGSTIKQIFEGHVMPSGHKTWDRVRTQYEKSNNEATWDQVYKFTMIRNPWARYLSLFSYRCTHDSTREFTKERFTSWLLGAPTNMTAGEVIAEHVHELDFIGKFEAYESELVHLATDLAAFLQTEITLDFNTVPHENAGTYPYYDWRPYYTDNMAKVVAELGAWEIRYYDYGFDDFSDIGV